MVRIKNSKEFDTKSWKIPNFSSKEFFPRKTKYCICIPVLNEGEKIKKQLRKMKEFATLADIIICDGGSNDGSTDPEFLKEMRVRTLLVKLGPGKLSAQLRMGYAFALREGYEGVITIDGNNKDGVEAIPNFIAELESGFDFVQGSRFVKGGEAVNTPLLRFLAIKLLHSPVISLLAGFRYTDTTNGFRGYSRRLLLDPKLEIFRDIFDTYDLLAYLSVKSPRFGYKTREIAVKRGYPQGKVPTKISFWKGNFEIMKIILKLLIGKYDTKKR